MTQVIYVASRRFLCSEIRRDVTQTSKAWEQANSRGPGTRYINAWKIIFSDRQDLLNDAQINLDFT